MFYNALNMHRLNKSFLIFSKAHLFFMVALNIQTVFVNILLIREAGDPKTTIFYNMAFYWCSGLSMLLGGAMAKRMNLRKVAFFGVAFQLIAYLIFLFFMQHVVSLYLLLAVLIGAGSGLFWFVYLNAISIYAKNDNRDVAMAFIGIFSGIIALLVPAIAGIVIGLFVDLTGYSLMFGCAFLFGGISLYFYAKLPNNPLQNQPTAYLSCFKQSLVHPACRYITLCLVTRCVRDGVFNFFLNILLYQFVTSETIIGINSLWVGLVGIFAQYVAGKCLRPNNRVKVMAIASLILFVSALVLYLNLSAWTILFLCTVNAFFVILLNNPGTSVDISVWQNMSDFSAHREEYIGMSELFRACGRMVGLVLLLVLPETPFGYVTTLALITAIQLVNVWSAKRAISITEKMEEQV